MWFCSSRIRIVSHASIRILVIRQFRHSSFRGVFLFRSFLHIYTALCTVQGLLITEVVGVYPERTREKLERDSPL